MSKVASVAAYAAGLGAPAETTRYGYDPLGRQWAVAEYNGPADATPDRLTKTDYDPLTGGVIKVDSSEGVIEHHYNESTGRLDRTWTASNDTTYQYDGQGRLWKVIVNKLNGQPVNQTTAYTYDAVGNLLTTTQDEGTATTTDDLVTTDTYDVLNRLDTLTAKVKGVTIFDQDYSHTSDGQKHDVLEHRYNASGILNGTTRTTWGYDDDGHLTSEQRDEGDDQVQNGGDYTDTFAFDLNGNRQSKTHDAVGTAGDVVTTSTYNDRDELTSTTTNGGTPQSVTYDPNGNTLTDGSTVYTWDLRNRMLTVTSNGVTTTYTYDESGVRVSKTTNGTKTTLLNDAMNLTGYAKPVEEWIGGTLSRTYIIGLTVLGQTDATGSITDILRDGRSYARSLVASGVVIQNVDYDAYGDPQNGVTPGTPAASPDGYRDTETGSYYQNARFRMDGRWLSQDNITQTAGDYRNANLFSFVYGDPLNGTDPSGHNLVGTLTTLGAIGIVAGLALPSVGLLTYAYLGRRQTPSTRTATGVGGPEISSNLIAIRSRIFSYYNSLPPNSPQQQQFGRAFWENPTVNWDITDLKNQIVGTQAFPAGTSPGINTVTVGNKVFMQEEVNYWLYGAWAAAVGISKTTLFFNINVYRNSIYGGTGIAGRQAWTEAGYDGKFTTADKAALAGAQPASVGSGSSYQSPLGGPVGKIHFQIGSPLILDEWQ